MKKFTALILVFVLVFLCGCTTKKANESETTTVTESQSAILKTVPTEPITTVVLSNEETDETLFYPKEIKVDPSDPYSEYIKKACDQLTGEWKSFSESNGNSPNSFYRFSKVCTDFFYSFNDIDGDGTKELLLGSYYPIGYRTEDSTQPVKIIITSVCSIKNGEVVKQSNAFCDPGFIWDRTLWSNGLISTTYKRQEDPSFQFVEFKNGELKAKVQVFSHYFYDEPHYYSAIYNENGQDTKITKEERDRIYNECCGNAKPVEIDWKRIDEYGT